MGFIGTLSSGTKHCATQFRAVICPENGHFEGIFGGLASYNVYCTTTLCDTQIEQKTPAGGMQVSDLKDNGSGSKDNGSSLIWDGGRNAFLLEFLQMSGEPFHFSKRKQINVATIQIGASNGY